jgi:hypothetical protein
MAVTMAVTPHIINQAAPTPTIRATQLTTHTSGGTTPTTPITVKRYFAANVPHFHFPVQRVAKVSCRVSRCYVT